MFTSNIILSEMRDAAGERGDPITGGIPLLYEYYTIKRLEVN